MNTMKKMLLSVLLALSALGLTASFSAFADGMSDVNIYCAGCHGLVVNGTVIAGGGKSCSNRGYQGWVDTINRMNGKGCGVPAANVAGIATYLTSLEISPLTCYYAYGTSFISTGTTCPSGTSTTPPPFCVWGLPTYDGATWVCPAERCNPMYPPSSTPRGCINEVRCYSSTGSSWYLMSPPCPSIAPAHIPPPTCANGLPSWDGSAWTCPIDTSSTTTTTTSTTSTSTTSSTTTTTVPLMLICYITGYYGGNCPLGSFPVQLGIFTVCSTTDNIGTCPSGTTAISPPGCINQPPMWNGSGWSCSTTTSSSTTTTSTTTTTTPLKCNTSVNGTTQYKYSGSGTCHDKDHLVNRESWCKKHAPHLDSNGSHAHAYPHPACM